MRAADFDFVLPQHLIAQHPTPQRDQSRLLTLNRSSRTRSQTVFSDIGRFLQPGDLLVFNDSKVIPARLRGSKSDSGGAVEILLLEEASPRLWWCMLRPGKRVRPGSRLLFHPTHPAHSTPLPAVVIDKNPEGHCLLQFEADVLSFAEIHGEIPLPPYIHRPEGTSSIEDRNRYQTVYARQPGSVAAPTAGLHFTPELLQRLSDAGIQTTHLTLHVGAGTFLPVQCDDIADHRMHEERFSLPAETAAAINLAKAQRRRVIAVGTTTARVLESVARGFKGTHWGDIPDSEAPPSFSPLPPVESGRTRIFLHPPCRFRVLDGLITNFHLPQSTLLMLVSAFVAPGEIDTGRVTLLDAYREAIDSGFRFFSYGDAQFIA